MACFENALRIAGGTKVQLAKASAAAEVARQLATVYRKRGQRARAESLFAQADRIERGEVGTPAQPESASIAKSRGVPRLVQRRRTSPGGAVPGVAPS